MLLSAGSFVELYYQAVKLDQDVQLVDEDVRVTTLGAAAGCRCSGWRTESSPLVSESYCRSTTGLVQGY